MRLTFCLLGCFALVLPTFGCRTSEVRVTVPHGFHGDVLLSCQTESDVSTSTMIDGSGAGTLPSCPTRHSRVYVVQDGQTAVVENVEWNRTGDGLLTGIHFVVR
jgi:hypothetical protein